MGTCNVGSMVGRMPQSRSHQGYSQSQKGIRIHAMSRVLVSRGLAVSHSLSSRGYCQTGDARARAETTAEPTHSNHHNNLRRLPSPLLCPDDGESGNTSCGAKESTFLPTEPFQQVET